MRSEGRFCPLCGAPLTPLSPSEQADLDARRESALLAAQRRPDRVSWEAARELGERARRSTVWQGPVGAAAGWAAAIAAVIIVVILLTRVDSSTSSGGGEGSDVNLPSNEQRIDQDSYGGAWPLAVTSGVLRCEEPGRVYFDADDGTTYMINGTARTYGDGEEIDPVWLDDPAGAGLKISVGDFIDDGLSLCA